MGQRSCVCCGFLFTPCKNVPGQKYCGKTECRRHRRATWQREKLKKDTDYRENQKEAQRLWREKNPGYMASYRASHPDYREREQERCRRRRIAPVAPSCRTTNPLCAVKMDSWVVQLTVLASDMKLAGAP
jgi:hypothetical protein